jgi:hypothetical protein
LKSYFTKLDVTKQGSKRYPFAFSPWKNLFIKGPTTVPERNPTTASGRSARSFTDFLQCQAQMGLNVPAPSAKLPYNI